MTRKVYTETDRLLLGDILPTDDIALFELDSDQEVHQYLSDPVLTDISQCKAIIDHIRRQYIDNGIGRCAVIEKSSGTFAGWSGLKLVHDTVNNHADFCDLGYRLI